MFAKNYTEIEDFEQLLIRFIPEEHVDDLDEYLEKNEENSKSFYSFLAEGLLGVIYNSILEFKVAHALIDINQTLSDTNSGVDGCMYNEEHKVLGFCEAKFYNKYSDGKRRIEEDLTESIKNKINSFYAHARSNSCTKSMILKDLKTDKITNVKSNDILSMNLNFLGFVLHSKNITDRYNYKNMITVDEIVSNLKNEFSSQKNFGEYKVYLFHLPINDKKQLIKKIIVQAEEIIKGEVQLGRL